MGYGPASRDLPQDSQPAADEHIHLPAVDVPENVTRLNPRSEFEVELRVPDEVRDVAALRQWFSKLKSGALAEIETFCKEAEKLPGWNTLSSAEATTIRFSVHLIAEEALSNLLPYGILGITSGQRELLFSGKDTPERQAVYALVDERLNSGYSHERFAHVRVKFGEGTVEMRFNDSDGFPQFEEKLAEAKAKLSKNDPDEDTNGRGLMLMLGMFDNVFRDPRTLERVCVKTMDGVREHLERLVRKPAEHESETEGEPQTES